MKLEAKQRLSAARSYDEDWEQKTMDRNKQFYKQEEMEMEMGEGNPFAREHSHSYDPNSLDSIKAWYVTIDGHYLKNKEGYFKGPTEGAALRVRDALRKDSDFQGKNIQVTHCRPNDEPAPRGIF